MSQTINICGIEIRECAAMPADSIVILGDNEVIVCPEFPQPDENGQIKMIKIPKIDLTTEAMKIRFYEPESPVDSFLKSRGLK